MVVKRENFHLPKDRPGKRAFIEMARSGELHRHRGEGDERGEYQIVCFGIIVRFEED